MPKHWILQQDLVAKKLPSWNKSRKAFQNWLKFHEVESVDLDVFFLVVTCEPLNFLIFPRLLVIWMDRSEQMPL